MRDLAGVLEKLLGREASAMSLDRAGAGAAGEFLEHYLSQAGVSPGWGDIKPKGFALLSWCPSWEGRAEGNAGEALR